MVTFLCVVYNGMVINMAFVAQRAMATRGFGSFSICGEFARNLLDQRKDEELAVVINDIKLLAQADVEPRISHFLSKDRRLKAKITQLSAAGFQLHTTLLDLNTPLACWGC